jgi:rhomboid protease GluP
MSESANSSLRETLLRQCLAAQPNPWYPKEFARSNGVEREALYSPLNDLRIANLVQLSEWIEGKGQGYTITPLGKEVLSDPLFLAQLRDGLATSVARSTVEPAGTDGETRYERGEAARIAFFSPGIGRVTPILILLNLLAFAASFTVAVRIGVPPLQFLRGGDVLALHKVGAVGADDLARGEWWRLLTNCFLHFGLMHITLNMFSLVLLRRVEALWGPGRFLMLYLICGICGSCVGVYFYPGDPSKSVYLAGASGALWGVLASEVVWLLLHRSHLPDGEFRQWLQQIFFTLLLNTGVSMLPGVSAAAHFGGGIAGLVAALLLQMHRYGSGRRRFLAGMLLALLPTLFMLGLATAMDSDPRLEPFIVKAYRDQVNDHVGDLEFRLNRLEMRAEVLHLQESTKRDAAELASVKDELHELVKQAKEVGEWVHDSSPGKPARNLRDKGQRLVDSLVAYASALEQHAEGATVADMNELRKASQEAKVEWEKAMTP